MDLDFSNCKTKGDVKKVFANHKGEFKVVRDLKNRLEHGKE